MRDIDKDRAIIAAATEGPWKSVNDEGVISLSEDDQLRGLAIAGVRITGKADAQFIAEARTALPYWMDEVERLKRAYDDERFSHNAHVTELLETEKKLEAVQQENERLKQRVEKFAAVLDKYLNDTPPHEHKTTIRRALEALKGE